MSSPTPSTTLYITPTDWKLPSKSIACIQLEVGITQPHPSHHHRPRPPPDLPAHGPCAIHHTTMHLRYRLPIRCASHHPPPPSHIVVITGHLPAVEVGPALLTPSRITLPASPATELLVAADLVTKLEQGPAGARDPSAPPLAPHSLDNALSSAHRAQAGAFAALLATKLQPALLHATWIAHPSFTRYTRDSFGRDLPFPLSYLVPWGMRRSLLQLDVFRGVSGDPASADTLVADAAAACRAIAAQLAAGKGFLLGDEPCSVDALLYGYLLYALVAPVIPPALRDVVRCAMLMLMLFFW